jgi:hypothetical protein
VNPNDPVVIQLPLDHLWNDRGELPPRRVRDIGAEEIRRLLRDEREVRFVVANVGERLEWVEPKEGFRFWKEQLAPHLVEPQQANAGVALDDVGEYAFVASEWRLSDGTCVVVAETWH